MTKSTTNKKKKKEASLDWTFSICLWRLRLSQGEQLLHALEWGAAEGDTPRPMSAAAAVRRHSMSKDSSGGREETPHVQGKKQQRNRQMWPWSPEWSRAKDNRALWRESTGQNKHDLPTTQEKALYTASADGQHRYQIDYILWSQRWRSSIPSAKSRLGADCGSDHELIAKFRLKLKKVGITTRQLRYDLNQIPYNYTTEVRNRFKGLDLIECLINYGRRFLTFYSRQGSRPFPRKERQKKKK